MFDFLQGNQPHVVLSACGTYRYQLWYPTGIEDARLCLGVFANPSTATDEEPDPTLTRWLGFSRSWGYGWAGIVNVCAFRATKPKDVPKGKGSIGPDNDYHVRECCKRADVVVCGWGNLAGGRAEHTLGLIREAGKTPLALKQNKDGSPTHPLYLRADLIPRVMR